MRILFLTFYYPPDLSAGSFRMNALIAHLLQRLPAGSKVDIITTKPNRYASFEVDSQKKEEHGPLSIERIPLPAHRSGIFDQARAFLAFDRAVTRLTLDRHYDLVFATSSKLMTAFLGARIANRKRVPLFLDIRDIFVDTMQDVFPGWKGRLLVPLLKKIESYTIQSASNLNLVSEGFRGYFFQRYPNVPTQFFTNGIDDAFLTESWQDGTQTRSSPIRILYAGNIGEGQGLHNILPELVALAGNSFKFVIVGDGGKKNKLIKALENTSGSEVEFIPPVDRTNLIRLYKECDILFLHLNDYEAFAKVLPSKLFEYAATGKPILAGVGGYAAEFLSTQVSNCQIFPPCNAEAGMKALKRLSLGETPRTEFIKLYGRSEIMGKMADSLLRLGVEACSKSS